MKKVVGVDTGVDTGFSVWCCDTMQFDKIMTLKIHQALKHVEELIEQGNDIVVRVEDARLRNEYLTGGREKLQGVGSVKRDAVIWEDFLKDKKIPLQLVAPKNNKTKLDKTKFEKLTGVKVQTSQHARDAAMLCFNYNGRSFDALQSFCQDKRVIVHKINKLK